MALCQDLPKKTFGLMEKKPGKVASLTALGGEEALERGTAVAVVRILTE